MRFAEAGLAALVFTTGCGAKNLAEVFFHPSVEQRAGESLALSAPAAITTTDPNLFHFAVFGDVQIRSENKSMLPRFTQDVGPNSIDFFVVLGDLTEDGTTEELTQVKADLDAVGIPYYATIGNHDMFQSSSSGGWAHWKDVFGPATYSVTIESAVRFLFLDTATGDIGPTQFAWLASQIQGTKVPFNIVGSHYPIYDGMTPLMWRLESPEERYKLTSLIDQLGVNYYVGGHVHGYKQNQVGNVSHIIVGSMYPYTLDYGNHGYVLFTYDHGSLSWQRVTFTDVP